MIFRKFKWTRSDSVRSSPYNIAGTEDFGLTSFPLSPTTSLHPYTQASTSAISLQLHASEKDPIALRPMSLGVSSLEDQRKHLLLDNEDERTPGRNYGGIVHTADLESNTVTSTRQVRTKISACFTTYVSAAYAF